DNWMLGWTGLETYKYLGSKQQGGGKVVVDQNANCEVDSLESGFDGFILSFRGADDTLFTQTNANGEYTISLDSGEYVVHLDLPNEYWSICDNDLLLNVQDTSLVEYPNFVLQAAQSCPFLTVDVSTPFLRRCFDNTYQINYCNSGTIPAADAEVQLLLDSSFTFVESSLPFSVADGLLYTFPVGDLDVGECGRFYLTINLSCEAFLGQSHCLEAVISPNTPCSPPTPSARIDITGGCENGNIEFSVENVGELDMNAPSELIVIEDDVMFLTQPFQLEQTAALPVMVIPEGKTIRIQTLRIPDDPTKGVVSRTIEGCGTNGELDPPYSTGFVNQFPLDEYEDHVAVDCRANQGAFDPNDKRAFPAGYGEEHAITPETELEYLIRFQNTGTDTAFTVLVHDTLSSYLDPTTIEVGAASHDFEWKLMDRLLVFHFADIMLPDSNVNEPASHGFVQFKIKPYVDTPLKTVIPNEAAIYFDFNEPILTPTIFHTLDRNFIVIPNINSTEEVELSRFRFYPSPIRQEAILELEDRSLSNGQFRLINAWGQVVIQDTFIGQRYQFHRMNLSTGLYFFQVFEDGNLFISGQLIIQ
nr:T9SS type A sorting domain-containing protein [Saprospiraceae bacterium]